MIVCAHIVEMLFQYFHNFIRIEGQTLHKVLINQYNIVLYIVGGYIAIYDRRIMYIWPAHTFTISMYL